MSPQDRAKLQKIGCHDLLDLALCVPKSYEHHQLASSLEQGSELLLACRIHRVRREPKRLVVEAEALGVALQILYFRYTPYHLKLFEVHSELPLKGKLERYGVQWQLIQPRHITEVGAIVCHYATTALRHTTIADLKARLLGPEQLVATGLPESVIAPLMGLHFPDAAFVRSFQNRGGFAPEYITALKYTEIFAYLRKLSTKKRQFPALTQLTSNPKPFIDSLPFSLTEDQRAAIAAIALDLVKPTAAKRIVVGDVGCGKTMVMLASMVIAHPHRSLLMAPTTVLANQLYAEARKHLPAHIRVALYTQESKDPEFANADVIIGTHALLYTEIPEAALVMIDEQHRFGTAQRTQMERFLERDGARPHVVQFSATPIPRTLAMIESALVDFSFIRQMPFVREVETRVVSKQEFPQVLAHLRSEISEGRQAIVVYPLVEESEHIDYLSIDEAQGFWQKQFPGVMVTHGRDRDKSEVLERFREEGTVLLATTVIEVGISLPRLSTIVIAAPERLGLATLHQLRGRVARNGLKGHCYLFTHHPDNARLAAFCTTESGFEIAELDLKFRESGDLLGGVRQSGKQFAWIDFSTDGEIVQAAKEKLGGG